MLLSVVLGAECRRPLLADCSHQRRDRREAVLAAKTVDPYVSAELAELDAPTRDVAASHATWLGLAGRGNIGRSTGKSR